MSSFLKRTLRRGGSPSSRDSLDSLLDAASDSVLDASAGSEGSGDGDENRFLSFDPSLGKVSFQGKLVNQNGAAKNVIIEVDDSTGITLAQSKNNEVLERYSWFDIKAFRVNPPSPVFSFTETSRLDDDGEPVERKLYLVMKSALEADQIRAVCRYSIESAIKRGDTATTVEEESESGREESYSARVVRRFRERLRADEVAGLVAEMNAFVSGFLDRPPPYDEEGPIVAEFVETTSDRLRETRLYATATPEEWAEVPDAVEAWLMRRIGAAVWLEEISAEDALQLHARMALLSFVEPRHLDISPDLVPSDETLATVAGILQALDAERTPLEKLDVFMEACQEIYGAITKQNPVAGADEFFPLLVLHLIRANPTHLLANAQFVLRVRRERGLASEKGYYFTQILSAIKFLETVNQDSLTISDAEWGATLGNDSRRTLNSTSSATVLRWIAESQASELDGVDGSQSSRRSGGSSSTQGRADAAKKERHAVTTEITDDERLQRYYHMDLDALTVEDVTGLLAVYKRLYANTQGRLARVMERSSRSSLSSP